MVLKIHRLLIGFHFILIVTMISACGANLPSPTAAPALSTISPTHVLDTPTAAPPTPTPVPLAARVNGEEITLQEFQEELARYKVAVEIAGTNMATVGEQIVMNDLVNQALLAQAAAEEGYLVDQHMVEERLEELALDIGGEQALANWISQNGYTQDSLVRFMARAMASAWMRDKIIETVPLVADQIHVRQILLNDQETAQEILGRLAAGRDFEDLAYEFDPLMGGDLGWLPKGYLAEEALDEAAFTLEAGEISPVIESGLGFHILQVVEKSVERPLSPDARLVLQERALQEWLNEHRSQSDIQLLFP
jgi:peptidyl-prolyl cis-trans isomerase C